MTPNFNNPDTLDISGIGYPIFSGPILPHWIETARVKGFSVAGRIIDRLHLAARCHKCGGLNKIRLFTLMSSQPLCAICLVSEWQEDARRAGLPSCNAFHARERARTCKTRVFA